MAASARPNSSPPCNGPAALSKIRTRSSKGGDSLSLDAINDVTDHGKQILASARRILAHLGQPAGAPVTLAQAMDANSVFASALFNGDGVIVPQCADDPALAAVIGEIADCMGAVNDRSGKPGIDQERADKFFEACAAFDGWMKQAEADARSILPAGADTAAAAAAVQAIKPKVDDYFGRCRVAAFDPRALDILNRTKEEYIQIAAHDLTIDAQRTGGLPAGSDRPRKGLAAQDRSQSGPRRRRRHAVDRRRATAFGRPL